MHNGPPELVRVGASHGRYRDEACRKAHDGEKAQHWSASSDQLCGREAGLLCGKRTKRKSHADERTHQKFGLFAQTESGAAVGGC